MNKEQLDLLISGVLIGDQIGLDNFLNFYINTQLSSFRLGHEGEGVSSDTAQATTTLAYLKTGLQLSTTDTRVHKVKQSWSMYLIDMQ